MKKEVFIKALISFYLFLLAVATWVNAVSFWVQSEKFILASVDTIFCLLLIASIISYFIKNKPLLIVNIVSVISFTIYFVGGFIWFMLTDYSAFPFAITMLIIIFPLNIIVIFYTKGKIEKFHQV